jgi:hypothetical protein
MTFRVAVNYDEGPPARHGGPFEDRAAALDHALALADDLGRSAPTGDNGPARWVSIHHGDRIDIAIQVIKGGLLGAPEAATGAEHDMRES